MKAFRQTEEFKNGRRAEQLVVRLLQQDGWFIIPSYDYCGQDEEKAPRLQGKYESYVLPDLDMIRKGERRWGEVKFKSTSPEFRITQTFVHGIPRRHFDDYLKVQELTGSEVWLYIFQEDSGELLRAQLNKLLPVAQVDRRSVMSRGGMVFFPRDCFFCMWKSREAFYWEEELDV